jgi:Leucine-rich repeat (LRR) protein
MTLVQSLLFKLGGLVAKTVLKRWFQDESFAQNASISVVDMLEAKLPDILSQRRGGVLYDQFAVEIAEKLLPFFELDSGALRENEKEAAICAVISTFERASISDRTLFDRNLDPKKLNQLLHAGAPDGKRDLSEPAGAFYDRLILECCVYLIEATSVLPRFELKIAQELLKRTSEIIKALQSALAELPKITDPGNRDEAFVTDYRRAIALKLDQLYLFGITTSDESCRRYSLSVAYISLTAAKATAGTSQGDNGAEYCRVDQALASSQRILIRGEAGSGKTTLLQWLAVRAARDDFEGELTTWRGRLPFFIQLRRWQKTELDLPKPEQFLDQIKPNLTGVMPQGWVTRQLKNGAIILVDGIDEIPSERRQQVKTWVDDLAMDFPESHIIVTSRPAAIEEGWLSSQGFHDSELQPMDLEDIQALIAQWHEAAKQERPESEKAQLDIYNHALQETVRNSSPIRRLAATPLLCAMICALHWDRRQNVPSDRMELYRIALEMLLDRRDVEQGLGEYAQFGQLRMRGKESLLRDFAYWLMRNGRSDCEREVAEQCLNTAQKSLEGKHYDPKSLLQFLLERSGLLREPIEDRVDFIHRTVQEYLAAKQAILQQDVDFLTNQADLPEWRETIILAAGHAGEKDADKLVRGLLARAETEVSLRHSMILLAVGCLETAVNLPPATRELVRQKLTTIMPPTNMSDANAVAAAGELAIPYLGGNKSASGKIVTACIRALTVIGGDAAFRALAEYSQDGRQSVIRELLRAQGYFEEIIIERLNWQSPDLYIDAAIKDLRLLQNLSNLRFLVIVRAQKIHDLASLGGLRNLKGLSLYDAANITSIEPLQNLNDLRSLVIHGGTKLTSIEPLRSLSNLRSLDLYAAPRISSLEPIAELTNLSDLTLHRVGSPETLEWVRNLTVLKRLNLHRVGDLSPVSGLADLETLTIYNASGITSLEPLQHLASLNTLGLSGAASVTSLEPIRGLNELKSLSLSGAAKITCLKPLEGLAKLKSLTVSGCAALTNLEPITTLTTLEDLDLSGDTGVMSLEPLRGLTNLKSLNLSRTRGIISLEPLKDLAKLTTLYLISASGFGSLEPIKGIKGLKIFSDQPII